MPYTDELVLKELAELNSTLKRLENLLQNLNQHPADKPLSAYPHQYCDEKTAAELTGLSRAWFSSKRWSGGGPPYTKMGGGKRGAIRYKVSDLFEWLERHKIENTSQNPEPNRPSRTR